MYSLCKMLNVLGKTYPLMHSLFVDRDSLSRKLRLAEGTDRNGNEFFSAFGGVVDRGPAVRAEVECGPTAFIANPHVRTGLPVHPDGLSPEARLRTEHTPGSALTREAMTDPDSNWLFGYGRRE